MPISQISEFLQNIRRAALRRDEAGWTDGQLLDAYVHSREEAAFAALVRRHGPMVWGVCRRVLGNEGDAEDAFQATFLVLVRKAAAIVPREQIANWLYGVAQQTAVKARAMAVKRKAREKQVKDIPEPAVAEQSSPDDLLPLLDQELSRLPDKYRTAIVLCDLEGKSYKEAARQLGCPEGTLAARLTRGRTMLAKRLARHSLAVTSGALATVLSQSASACVPASVVSSTITAASLFAAGQAVAAGAISVKVAALTEGVLRAMLLSKLKMAMAVLFLLVAVASGLGLVEYNLQAADQAEAKKNTKAPTASSSDSPATLKKARLAAARKAYDKVWEQYQRGLRDEEQVYRWSRRLLEAEREVAAKKAERVAALEGHLSRMKELEKTAPDRLIAVDPVQRANIKGKLGMDKDGNMLLVLITDISRKDIAVLIAFYRAEAEVWLAEAKVQ